jgi:hypothetical protein
MIIPLDPRGFLLPVRAGWLVDRWPGGVAMTEQGGAGRATGWQVAEKVLAVCRFWRLLDVERRRARCAAWKREMAACFHKS